jgi:flagellar biosynthesis/type III secretory pathway M-ring protein FliF/YscJ
MWLYPVFDFVAKNRWVQWILLALLILGTMGLYLAWRDNGVRKREREKQEVREAEQREILIETVNQLEQETEDAKDRALAAPDAIDDVASPDELRERYPDNAAVILRPRATSGGRGPR